MHRHHLTIRLLTLTLIFGSMYSAAYYFNRSLANDMPQLLATQTAKRLDAGLGIDSIQMGRTNLANNPVPFVIVYDKKEKPVAGSGYLKKKLAKMPAGVVQHAAPGKPHAVTWAPREDIRIASVTVAANDYYVVGGQSLERTDSRNERLFWIALAGYSAVLLVTVIVRFCRCRRCRTARANAIDLHDAACTCKMCKANTADSKPAKKQPAPKKKPAAKSTVKPKKQKT